MSKVSFGDILYIKGRIGWQALKKEEYLENGDYYLVTGVDITNDHRIDFNNCYFVSKERYEMDDKIQLAVGDIIVTKDGTIGKIGLIDKLDKPATLNSHLFLIRNLAPDILDTKFLFYILKSNAFQKFAVNNTSGSNIPAFTQANISKFEIDLPDLSIQKRIASILSNIDARIINNNKISAELECLAKTIYDYWFLQFEFPNEEGKPYKSSGGKMVYNEELKREIPEGWEVGNLYDIADFVNGLACQKIRPTDPTKKLPVIKISEMHDGYTNKTEWATSEIDESHIINYGDIVFSWSATLEAMLWDKDRGALNQHIFKVIPKDYDKYYVFQQLSAYIINFVKMAEARKTTMGHITSDHLKQSRIILPPKAISDEYGKRVQSLYDELLNSARQNQQLASLRDWLLPMLMNGQVTFTR